MLPPTMENKFLLYEEMKTQREVGNQLCGTARRPIIKLVQSVLELPQICLPMTMAVPSKQSFQRHLFQYKAGYSIFLLRFFHILLLKANVSVIKF